MYRSILFFIFVGLLAISCDNEINTIGQDLIDDDSFIEVVEKRVRDAGTIKLDSFVTSNNPGKIVIGRTDDPITGVTSSIPHIILNSSGFQSMENTVYDSLTFQLLPPTKIWGDTNQLQHFYLIQLAEVPVLDPDEPVNYNVTQTKFGDTLAKLSFYPLKKRMEKLYFKLDDQLGQELYQLIRTNDNKISNNNYFLSYFKGVAIVPGETNTCLMQVKDSLELHLHYHAGKTNAKYSFFPASNSNNYYSRYSYNYIHNDASGTAYANAFPQTSTVSFADAGNQMVTQGLGGFFIKLRLPMMPPSQERFSTIIKVELVFKSISNPTRNLYPNLETIYMYESDENNRLIRYAAINNDNIVGSIVNDPENPNETEYVINMTDYFNKMSSNSGTFTGNNYFLIGFGTSTIQTSFDRMVIDELPILRVYYANYQ